MCGVSTSDIWRCATLHEPVLFAAVMLRVLVLARFQDRVNVSLVAVPWHSNVSSPFASNV